MYKRLFIYLAAVSVLNAVTLAENLKGHPQTDVYDGWRLGVQAWSFNKFTLFESIDKTRRLGLDTIQAYPGQKISQEIDAGFGPGLSPKQCQAVRDKLAEAQVRLAVFGVATVPAGQTEARKLFEFAREMGIETIVSEPSEDQFEMIDTLCQEYKIKLAVHNHPAPTHYWNPDTVLKVCQGRSKWIGACTDVGHWVRSGLDPVESLKKLQGRILDVHIKEIDDGHDVVWGTGQGRIKGILEELHRQGYQGTFAIEYEYNWDNNIPQIRESVAYFNSVASTLKPTGWKHVLEPDLSNMEIPGSNWFFKDGELSLNPMKKGSDLWTKAKVDDFVLDLEFKLSENANSGVFLRTQNHEWLPWIEVQIEDSYGKAIDKHSAGGIYDIQAPAVNAVKPAGQWNRMTIFAEGPRIQVILNNHPVLDINLDDWTEPHTNPDGTTNKFDIAYKDLPRAGWIGLQDHGGQVWFRNIKIKEQ